VEAAFPKAWRGGKKERSAEGKREKESEREGEWAVPWNPIWAMDLAKIASTAHKPPIRGLWC
jgi:hypothetical protein